MDSRIVKGAVHVNDKLLRLFPSLQYSVPRQSTLGLALDEAKTTHTAHRVHLHGAFHPTCTLAPTGRQFYPPAPWYPILSAEMPAAYVRLTATIRSQMVYREGQLFLAVSASVYQETPPLDLIVPGIADRHPSCSSRN